MSKFNNVLKNLQNTDLKFDLSGAANMAASPSPHQKDEQKRKRKLTAGLKDQIQALLDMPDDLEVLIFERRYVMISILKPARIAYSRM
jgi:hypothetical protein